MKKSINTLLKCVMALSLVIILASPLQAMAVGRTERTTPAIPVSFDFDANYEFSVQLQVEGGVPAELAPVLDVLGGPITIGTSGTMFIDEALFRMQASIDLDVPQLGLPMTVNAWLYVDVTDLDDPTVLIVAELPEALRFMLMFSVGVEFGRQFWVLDLSEALLEGLSYADEFLLLHDDMALFLEEYHYDIEEAIYAMMERIGEVLDIRLLEYSFSDDDGEYRAELEIEAVVTDGLFSLDFNFSFDGGIANVDTADEVVMPAITPANSFNVLDWLVENF